MTSNALPTAPPPRYIFDWSDELKSFTAPHNLVPHCNDPVPTNAWWSYLHGWDGTNESTIGREDGNPVTNDSKPIFANPYTYRIVRNRGLAVSYLYPSIKKAEPKKEDGSIPIYSYPSGEKHLILSASEWTSTQRPKLQIDDWDDLGVNLTLAADNDPSQFAKAYLAQGNVFTSMEYRGLHACLYLGNKLSEINGESVKNIEKIKDKSVVPYMLIPTVKKESFELTMENGSVWIMFFFVESCKTPTQLQYDETSNSLVTTEPFSGVVQVAFVAESKDDKNKDSVKAAYQKYAGCYATHAKLFVEDGGAAFGYKWRLRNVRRNVVAPNAADNDQYMHFVLKHLQDMMDTSQGEVKSELQLNSQTRGSMKAYPARLRSDGKFELRFEPSVTTNPLSHVATAVSKQAKTFLPLNPKISKTSAESFKLEQRVKDELAIDWHAAVDGENGYYYKGKMLQKLGSVCLVAWQLASQPETTSPKLIEMTKEGIATLRTIMKLFIANHSKHWLVYDTSYRGIITTETFHTKDRIADFGNAYYNDHHYHYGYIVMAAAMLIYLETKIEGKDVPMDDFHNRLRGFIETLIRDVANPNSHDAYFPRFRYFSWFLGHSYSHGVDPLDDGKDEESTTEEVNFFYGVALFAKMTNNTRLEQLAKLMLTINIHAIQTYILLEDDSKNKIHPPEFAKNLVTGIYFDNKCDYNTWFSKATECIHGIQMIPVSPMNDVLRTKKFVEKEWHQKLEKLPCVVDYDKQGSGWTSLLYSNFATVNPDGALGVLKALTNVDQWDKGLSPAWALYMAATKTNKA